MVEFARRFPSDYYDVAIAEQHAVTLAAGLACDGMKPVVAIYSTFLQRGYDQLIHDVALQNLDVTFGIDRAGLVGQDGPTHHGAFDLSYLRCIPNMVIAAPSDENECRQLLYTGFLYNGPAAVRYPRGTGSGAIIAEEMTELEIGKAVPVRSGEHVAILSFGTLLPHAVEAAERLGATVVDISWDKARFLVIPGPVKTSRVHERAIKHFKVGADGRTGGKTGILIYLSMREHRAEIVADEPIAEKVSADVWGEAMADMLVEIKQGKIAEGMAAGVRDVGEVLSEHFPRLDDDENELPDRLIEV